VTDRTMTDRARRVALLGAAIDMGASQRGTLMGPAALRTAGLAMLLESLDFEVVDYGDLSVAEREGWEVVPGVVYTGGASGTVDHAVFEAFWSEVKPVLERA